MVTVDSLKGRVALGVTHCAGLIDMVALPLWVNVLVGHYRLDPQQAGMLLTLFMVGVVLASVILVRLFHRVRGRWISVLGFGAASFAMYRLSQAGSFAELAALHVFGGVCIGAALSMTEGTVARSRDPHRLFAVYGAALGAFALAFLVSMPQVIAKAGGPALFLVFTGVMALAAVVSLVAFPTPDSAPPTSQAQQTVKPGAARIWFGVTGMALMGVTQALSFSFLAQVGAYRAFGADRVHLILAMLGVINLVVPLAAGFLKQKLSARHVLLMGPVLQGALVYAVYNTGAFPLYAVAGSTFVAALLFTQVFFFGHMAGLDPSGKVLAGLPAMMMTGAAIGPIVAGTLIKFSGYPAVGVAAAAIGVCSLLCFHRLTRVSIASASVPLANSGPI